jgi:hypothetical protein
MAAAVKALNAKIRSNKYLDYFCSTRTYSRQQATKPANTGGRGHHCHSVWLVYTLNKVLVLI